MAAASRPPAQFREPSLPGPARLKAYNYGQPLDSHPEWPQPVFLGRLREIISGGQTGADQGALKAGKDLGLKTGGWIPKGWRTLDGPRPDLGSDYGLKEHPQRSWPPRTEANVRSSNATLWFGEEDSGGGRLTLRKAREHERPHLVVPWRSGDPVPHAAGAELRQWLGDNQVAVLNVAGNRESGQPGIEDATRAFLVRALSG